MAIRDSVQIPQDVLAQVRRMIDEPSQTPYDDETIRQVYERSGQGFERTVANLWDEKAARQASLVDVTEGSSSRKMSQARTASLAMAGIWRSRADALEDEVAPPASTVRRTVVRAIRRV